MLLWVCACWFRSAAPRHLPLQWAALGLWSVFCLFSLSRVVWCLSGPACQRSTWKGKTAEVADASVVYRTWRTINCVFILYKQGRLNISVLWCIWRELLQAMSSTFSSSSFRMWSAVNPGPSLACHHSINIRKEKEGMLQWETVPVFFLDSMKAHACFCHLSDSHMLPKCTLKTLLIHWYVQWVSIKGTVSFQDKACVF